MKRSYYDNKPSTLESIGNGSYFYRWDIAEERFIDTMSNKEVTQYSCNEVIVWLPLTSNKILQKVLETVFPNNREQKYVNEYNAALLGMYDEDEIANKINNYKDFLTQRASLKAQVDCDCKQLNIPN